MGEKGKMKRESDISISWITENWQLDDIQCGANPPEFFNYINEIILLPCFIKC